MGVPIKHMFFFEKGQVSPQLLHSRDAHDFFIRLFTTPYKENYKDRTEATKLTTARYSYITDDGGQ
jgi:hypothetical protein